MSAAREKALDIASWEAAAAAMEGILQLLPELSDDEYDNAHIDLGHKLREVIEDFVADRESLVPTRAGR